MTAANARYHRVRHSGGHYERLGAALSETSEWQYKRNAGPHGKEWAY